MDEVKILITGGNGYIAKSLNHALSQKYQITSITRSDFDLTNHQQTCEWFDGKTFDVVIHTAISGGSRLQLDDSFVFDKNMAMFNNLVANQKSFSKLISFGSGAEIFHGNTPYGNSKREIAKQILQYPNFYNLRIFGVFDYNELGTRFIKSNITRYLMKQPMLIHSNKIMDFFYMKDLISLVEYYVNNKDLEQTINCSYESKYTLKTIAELINTFEQHNVPVVIQDKDKLDFYCGSSNLPISVIGFSNGLRETFTKLSEPIL